MPSSGTFLFCASLCLAATTTLADAPAVELELVPSARAPLTASQDWIRALSSLKAVRIRATHRTVPRPTIQRKRNLIRIIAIIDSGNGLVLPGKRFSLRQQPAIADWIETQRAGKQSKDTSTARFGLTNEQLRELHETLKPAVQESTIGKNTRTVVLSLTKLVSINIQTTSEIRHILGQAKVDVELQGLTAGTALAAVVHPLELVVVPQTAPRGDVQLVIARPNIATEAWPVGWKLEQRVHEAVPKFFHFLEIEITETPIREVLAALEERLGMPILIDQPALDIQEIDLSEKKVSIPSKRTFYKKILDQVLFMGRLDGTIRVDERGKPFLWITTLMPK